MAATSDKKRTEDVRVRLSGDMMDRLKALSVSFGMPHSTLAAFAVADWVKRQENNAQLARMAVLDATRNGMPDQELLMQAIQSALPEVTKALMQANLPLDGEASQGGA